MKQTIDIGNRISELGTALDELESLLLGEGLSREIVSEMRLVAEEGISNIIRYASDSGEDHRIQVILSVDGEEIGLEFRDDGKPFNPLDMPEPDLDADIEDRPNGGLGIHLMKTLTDEAFYLREGDRNVLKLKKRLTRK